MKIDLSSISLTPDKTIREAMASIDQSGLGMILLVDDEGWLRRTVTDGDLRRELLDGHGLSARLGQLPQRESITVSPGYTRRSALSLLTEKQINAVPVVDEQGRVVDLVHRATLGEPILLSTPHMGEEERQFVEQAFASNWIAPLGPNVDAFEAKLAAKVGIGHAAAVSSGTAAIHLALRLLDIGPDDRVFCSDLTFVASANPIIYQGAEPVFIDSERHSWNMCPVALDRALEHARREGRLPKAIIVVNLYGQSADMDPILDLAGRHGISVIEDAAESLGAKYKGKASGTFGRMGIFSFNGNKIITTSGGGMLVSDDESLIAKARFLATQARDPAPHYQHSEIGYNYRMSNILAGVGRGQLKVLDNRVASRRRIFEMYREGLVGCGAIEWMPEPEWSRGTRWLSVGLVASLKNRTELIHRLAEDLIEARPVWKPMHLQPVFADAPFFSAENRAVSEELFERGICLPSGSNLTDTQVDRIIEAVRAALAAPA